MADYVTGEINAAGVPSGEGSSFLTGIDGENARALDGDAFRKGFRFDTGKDPVVK